MPAFLRGPISKTIIGLVALLVIAFIAFVVMNLLSSSTGLSSSDSISFAPGMAETQEVSMSRGLMAPAGNRGSTYYEPPITPTPNGYTANLEAYETTSYYLTGRLREFETGCATLAELKANDRYQFKSLTTNLNSCTATFYTEDAYVSEALNRLEQFSGVTVNRNTVSVTRHREQIQSRASIIRQQLASVQQTLSEAETAYDEIALFARNERDVAEYSNAINTKLQQIDELTQRKISLTSQLQSIAQQAADLEERIGVIEISVSFTRSYALNPEQSSRAWEQAWKALQETWTNFGIGLTAYFGIFLLFVVQYGLYLLVLIAVARVGWKVARKIWQL